MKIFAPLRVLRAFVVNFPAKPLAAIESPTAAPVESASTITPLSPQARRMMLAGLMAPFVMTILNQAMSGVALPIIRDYFAVTADVAAWIATVYSLPFMMLMPFYGRMGDGLGKRRLMLAGIAIFGLGTAIALVAGSLWLFMLGRAIQGIGAAGMAPLAMAIISGAFPARERGRALGTWNTSGPVNDLAAPLLAGFLIGWLGWRSIFAPVLLAAVIALIVVKKNVPPGIGQPRPKYLRTFDWGGVILLSAMLTGLLFYLSSRPITGVQPLNDWRLLTVTLLLGLGFYLWERRRANPFVDFAIFRNKTFNQVSFVGALRMVANSAIGFLIPLYLVDVRGAGPILIGTIVMFHGGALLLTIRLGGLAADRWGSRWPTVGGIAAQLMVMLFFGLLAADAPLWLIAAGLVLHGLGSGLALTAMHRSAMSGVAEAHMGMAAGMYNMIRFGGVAVGTALCGVLLQNRLDQELAPIEAYQGVFLIVGVITAVGVIIGLWIRD
jgi:MFS family permease